MDTWEAIRSRRAVKKFLNKDIPQDLLAEVLEAGRFAPSSGNIQNWNFIVVRSVDTKKSIAQHSYEQVWMEGAPVLVVVTAQLDRARTMFGARGERMYSLQNCMAAAQNMMLMATHLGLASNFVSVFNDEEVGEVLGLPEFCSVQGIVVLGYGDGVPDMPARYELENITFFESFGNRISDMEDAMGEFGGSMADAMEKVGHAVQKVNDTVEDESKGIFDKIKKMLK